MAKYHCPCCGLFHAEGEGEVTRLREMLNAAMSSSPDWTVREAIKNLRAENERLKKHHNEMMLLATQARAIRDERIAELERQLVSATNKIEQLVKLYDEYYAKTQRQAAEKEKG